MTGIIEAAAVAAVCAAVGHSKADAERQETRVALEIYDRIFHGSLMASSAEKATYIASTLPDDCNMYAASSIQIVERYQKDRRRHFMFFSSGREPPDGDIRTRVLEEMKRWLITVSDNTTTTADVCARMEYCSQFMLYPSVFDTKNDMSFLETLAHVCKQLELLYKQTLAKQRTGADQLEQVSSLGRDIVHATLPVLIYALPSETAIPIRRFNTVEPLDLGVLLGTAAAPADPDTPAAGAARALNRETDVGRVLQALLSARHVRCLHTTEEAPAQGAVSSTSAVAGDVPLHEVLEEVRARWAAEGLGEDSGLLKVFCDPALRDVRGAYLDLCFHLDRAFFFLAALRPYHQLVGMAGDVVLCWFRQNLGHLLQELDKAFVQVHQARLEVMRRAKRHLQQVAKDMARADAGDVRWMTGLRHVDEVRLNPLHKAIAAKIADTREATARIREVELQREAQLQLNGLAATMTSNNFQARCSFVADVRQLASQAGMQCQELQG